MPLYVISPLSPNQKRRVLHRWACVAIQIWLESAVMAGVDNDTLGR
ncbi:hypothetical protein EV13_2795 [Prochlorococcus sp. MIT 0702]|nr:hypothetical protein EV13_2795 [Prochlorococcus sp. MIT 0702]KGG30802.1 hypothetical protein EV14_2738 [Prochlorococcus sp. MIT 0703]